MVDFVSFTNPKDEKYNADAAYKNLLAQQLQMKMDENGRMKTTPHGDVVPITKTEALANGLKGFIGAYNDKKQGDKAEAENQSRMQMLAQALGMGGEQGSNGGEGGNPFAKAYALSQLGAPDAIVKGMIDYGSPTSEMKNAGASGYGNPFDYQKGLTGMQEHTKASYAPHTITTPDGRSIETSTAQWAQQVGSVPESMVGRQMPAMNINQMTDPAQDPMQEWQQAQPAQQQRINQSLGQPSPVGQLQWDEMGMPNDGQVGGAPLNPEMNDRLASAVNEPRMPGIPVQSPSDEAFNKTIAEGNGARVNNATDTNNKLANFSRTLSAAKGQLADINDMKMGPLMGRMTEMAGDPQMVNLKSTMNMMALQAKDLLGMPSANFSDSDRNFMTAITGGNFPDNMSLGQVIDKMDALNRGTYDANMSVIKNPSKPAAMPAPVSGPKPGLVEDGYRFKGGNPSDPNAWEKVQ